MVLGQSVTLACQVSAQPAAQATWTKGKEVSWGWGAGRQGVLLGDIALIVWREMGPKRAGVSGQGAYWSHSPGLVCPAADGAPLESTSRLLISSTLKNFQLLTILVVTAEDLGVYTCHVSNALGTVASTAVLRKAGERNAPGPLSGDGAGTDPDGGLLGHLETTSPLVIWFMLVPFTEEPHGAGYLPPSQPCQDCRRPESAL